MVSVFQGEITRTWHYIKGATTHVINLYHDTTTGVRSAMLDNEEIVGSMGMSTVFMDKNGHRILFGVHGTPGYIEIKKSGAN